MKKLMVLLSMVPVLAFAEDYYYWQGVDGVYNGTFDDGTHWKFNSTSGVVPGANCRAYIGGYSTWALYKDYTVTMPSGAYDNFAKYAVTVFPGHTVVVDGTSSVFRHPTNTTAYAYNSSPYCLFYNGISQDILSLNVANAVPTDSNLNTGTAPHFEVSNTKVTLSSPEAKRMTAEFEGGTLGFYNVLGNVWKTTDGKGVYPRLYLCNFNNNNAAIELPIMDYAEVVFRNGASLEAPNLCIQGNAWTNVIRFTGGTHTATYCYIPARFDGQQFSENATETELIAESNATFTIAKPFYLGQEGRCTNRIARIIAREGAAMTFNEITGKYGHHGFIADGGTISFVAGNQDLRGTAADYSAYLKAVNGGVFVFDQQGGGAGTYFGHASNTRKQTAVAFTNATLKVMPDAKFNVYNGDVSIKNSLVDKVGGTISFGGSTAPVDVRIEDSVVTNTGSVAFGGNGAVNAVITNTVWVGPLQLGGPNTSDLSAVGVAQTNSVEVVDSEIGLGTDRCYVGLRPKERSVLNFRSGSLSCTSSAVGIWAGYCGAGEFNMYGGEADVFQVSVAGSGTAETEIGVESVLAMYGGTLNVRCRGNGEFSGFAVAESSNRNRRGRLVMNGGVVTSYTTFGGQCAANRGGSGYAAFEANGGTLKAPSDSTYMLHHFDEAVLGEDGLTVDADGHDITVSQNFTSASAASEGGLLKLVGEGVKKYTGDASDVNVKVVGGTADLYGAYVGSLELDGAVIKVRGTAPVIVAGAVKFNGPARLSLPAGAKLDDEFNVVQISVELGAEEQNWTNAKVVSGLPEGLSYRTSVDYDYDLMATVLKVTVCEPVVTEISLAAGELYSMTNYQNSAADQFTVDVAEGADLTLAGSLAYGKIVKDGAGILRLANVENDLIGGFLLTCGELAFADFAALGLGTEGVGKLKNGVLEYTGYENKVITTKFDFMQSSTNDIVIIKNDVDVTMPIPSCSATSGEFLKRGQGRLTFGVEGGHTLPHGYGKCSQQGGWWPQVVQSISQLKFDEVGGMPLTNGIVGLTVVEGELRLVGATGSDRDSVTLAAPAAVGVSCDEGGVTPGLFLDNVDFNMSGQNFFLGVGINYSGMSAYFRQGDFALEPYVVLTNGASMKCSTFMMHRFSDDSNANAHLDVYGSTLTVTSDFTPCRAQASSVRSTSRFRDGSALYAKVIQTFRDCSVEFDNSVLAKNSDLEPMTIRPETGVNIASCTGHFGFRNGSKFCCNTITPPTVNMNTPLTFTFDDSEWIPTLTGDYTFEWASPEKVAIVVENAGLKLPVPAAKTWTFNQPVTGAGGVVANGAGTLAFGNGMAQFTGTLAIGADATVDFAAETSGIAFPVKGAGTLANAKLNGASIVLAGGVPTLDGCTAVQRIEVDAGALGTADIGSVIDVAKLDGGTVTASDFRLKSSSTGVSGSFSLVGDTVRMTVIAKPGSVLIFQ